jgi:hypothetical protein
MDDISQGMLMQYAEEISCAILEQAGLLAKHRGENVVTLEDMTLALTKRFGLALPEFPLTNKLHKDTIPVHQSIVSISLKRQTDSAIEPEAKKKKIAKGGG